MGGAVRWTEEEWNTCGQRWGLAVYRDQRFGHGMSYRNRSHDIQTSPTLSKTPPLPGHLWNSTVLWDAGRRGGFKKEKGEGEEEKAYNNCNIFISNLNEMSLSKIKMRRFVWIEIKAKERKGREQCRERRREAAATSFASGVSLSLLFKQNVLHIDIEYIY